MPRLQQLREVLGALHRGRADEDRLARLIAFGDVLHDGAELAVLRLEDEVSLVRADHRAVRRDRYDVEVVGGGELGRLRLGRARHAAELLVHAEVVLQGDRRPGVVLLLDAHALLRLDSLVEAVVPAPALEDAAGELVDDLHLAVGHHVVVVPVVELLGLQGLLQLVNEVGGHAVVEVLDSELALHLGDARLGDDDGLLLLVDLVIDVPLERPGDAGELVVELGGLVGGAGDEQRCASLIDEDRVDLVDDAIHVAALHHLLAGPRHVVAQVVETHLGVRPVGEIRGVGGPLLLRTRDLRHDEPDREPEELVDLAHPLRVAPGQVVVDGDDVDAPAVEGVQIDRQCRDEGLALTGLHLGDAAEVERHPAHHLLVEVALTDRADARLADDGEGFHEEVVQLLTLLEALPELDGLAGEILVGERLHLGLEPVDERHDRRQVLDLLAFARAKNFREQTHDNPF